MRALTATFVLAFTVCALAQVTKQERAGIVNFSKVDAVVACGGATETSALDGLAKDGFKSVINLRAKKVPKKPAKKQGVIKMLVKTVMG